VFDVDPLTGQVLLIGVPSFDVGQYTLLVTASDGRVASAPTVVHVELPRQVRLCLAGHTELVARPWVPLWLRLGAELGSCANPGNPWQGRLLRLVDSVLDRLG
jgi:hypothetical protein